MTDEITTIRQIARQTWGEGIRVRESGRKYRYLIYGQCQTGHSIRVGVNNTTELRYITSREWRYYLYTILSNHGGWPDRPHQHLLFLLEKLKADPEVRVIKVYRNVGLVPLELMALHRSENWQPHFFAFRYWGGKE